MTRFPDIQAPEVMISCSLAGAHCPKVLVGDLIVLSQDSKLSNHAEEVMRKRGISFPVGPSVTVSLPGLTPEARRDVSASSQAIGVDMESQTIAELCWQRGIRCMAIKGVSDGIEDDLSPILGGFEIVRIPKIAKHVLLSPSTWGLAFRMALQSFAAATNLVHGVWATLQTLH